MPPRAMDALVAGAGCAHSGERSAGSISGRQPPKGGISRKSVIILTWNAHARAVVPTDTRTRRGWTSMTELHTETLPLLPLTTGVVLPGMVVTLTIESPDAAAAIEAAAHGELIVVPWIEGRDARVGTVARVEEVGKIRGGAEAAVIRGLHRGVVGIGVPGTGSATWVQIEPVEEDAPGPRARALAGEYRATLETIVEARGLPQIAEFLRGIDAPGQIADMAGYSPDLSFERKVEILETVDVEQRLAKVLGGAKDTLAEVEVKERIRDEVSENLEKRQREMILREQMAAIRKELGDDDGDDVVAQLRDKIEGSGMPDAVREQAERELGRLERTS